MTELVCKCCAINSSKVSDFVEICRENALGERFLNRDYGTGISKICVVFFGLEKPVETATHFDKPSRTLFLQVSVDPDNSGLQNNVSPHLLLFERLRPLALDAIHSVKSKDFNSEAFDQDLSLLTSEWTDLAIPLGSNLGCAVDFTRDTVEDNNLLPSMKQIFEPLLASHGLTPTVTPVKLLSNITFGNALQTAMIMPDTRRGIVSIAGSQVKKNHGVGRTISVYLGRPSRSSLVVFFHDRLTRDGAVLLRPIAYAGAGLDDTLGMLPNLLRISLLETSI
jgi:hypothetical protein